jgi:two-component system, NarL family, response regulator LiaR
MRHVLLVEDDIVYQAAVAAELTRAGFAVTAYSHGKDVLAARADSMLPLFSGHFQAALVDLRLGCSQSTGHDVISSLRQQCPTLCIAALTAHCTDEDIFTALAAGADGYLAKSEPISALPAHLHTMMQGGAPLTASIAKRLMMHFSQQNRVAGIEQLSPRELTLLQLLSSGATFSDCADQLAISAETVKTMVKRIRAKLHANSVAQAITVGFRMGILR